jgi:ABC-type multidrug transport system ATPase subunit
MIETHDLTKMYGDLYALNRLDLTLQQGDVYGFIGPNGAGKTTTMRILATLLNPTWGEATVCGYSIYNGAKDIRRAIGYMPDFFGVYDDMKVIEYLEFFAAAYRIQGPARKRICEEVLELVDICNKIGIIEQGVLLVNGAVVDVMKQVRTDIVLNIAVVDRLTDAANLLEAQPEVETVQDKNGVLIVKLNEGVNQYSILAQRLIEQGYELTLFKEDEINLETAFMHLTKGITS